MPPLAEINDLARTIAGFIEHPEPGLLDERFNSLVLELFRLQYASVDCYRRLCDRRRAVPGSLRTWRDVPALPVAAFREFDVTSLPSDQRQRVFHSSGTTGPGSSRHYHSPASMGLYESSIRPWFHRHLLGNPNTSNPRPWHFVALTPSPAEVPHSSLVHMIGTVAATWGGTRPDYLAQVGPDGSWQLDPAQVRKALDSPFPSNQAICLLGPAFAYVHLLDQLEAQSNEWPHPPGARLMETGGYKGRSRTVRRSDLYARLSDRLHIPPTHIVGEYGMTELSSQAYDRVAGLGPDPTASAALDDRHFRFPHWARALVVSPEDGREVEPGQTGLLRIFDLANTHSVLALQTEDLALRHADGFQLLGRAPSAGARGCSLALAEPR
jgi:hypothetical protein